MANVPKAITDLPVASAMGDDDLLVVSQNATTSSIKGELIKGYAQNAVASQVTAAQTAANQAGQSATQAEAARQGAAAAQTAAENAQDAAETARDQSVAAAGTIGDSVEQAQTAAGQASSAKDAAVAAQTAAEAAKTAAETASGQAQTAATQASGSATAAQTAATQAGDAKTDAETARNEAEASASSAANSASDAESAATEAEQAKTYIENMDMEGETLPAGSSVTVTKTTSPEGNLLFVIGVPQGIQGDKGETGETGATGPQGVSITNATVNEDGDLVITLSAGDPINAGSVIGPQGIQGDVGPTGASVDRIERTSGTGAPGTTDTYTVYLTDGKTGGTFQVYNGSNGTGSGDFMADGSVPMTGNLQMGGHVVTGMADGTEPTDGATVGQLAGKLDSPDGGTAGQVLTKTADGSAWEDAPSGLPEGGTEGQVLKRGASGPEWGDKPVMYVNITESGGTYSADKTFAEIESAIESEYSVVANVKEENEELEVGFILPLAHFVSGSVVMFSLYLDGSYYFASVAANNFASYSEVKIKAISISFTPTSTLTSENVQDAIEEVDTQLSTKLTTPTGTAGQLLGFTANNTVGAVDAPEPGLTQEQADERYLQLSGGTMTGDIVFDVDAQEDRVGAIKSYNCFVGLDEDNGITIGYLWNALEGRYSQQINFGPTAIEVISDVGGFRVSKTPSNNDDVANKSYVDSKSPTSVAITLTTSGWSSNTQTVTVSGVSATETAQLITPTPAIASQSAYYEAGIMCTGQAANSLTFTCQTVPTSNLTVYVVIQPLS